MKMSQVMQRRLNWCLVLTLSVFSVTLWRYREIADDAVKSVGTATEVVELCEKIRQTRGSVEATSAGRHTSGSVSDQVRAAMKRSGIEPQQLEFVTPHRNTTRSEKRSGDKSVPLHNTSVSVSMVTLLQIATLIEELTDDRPDSLIHDLKIVPPGGRSIGGGTKELWDATLILTDIDVVS